MFLSTAKNLCRIASSETRPETRQSHVRPQLPRVSGSQCSLQKHLRVFYQLFQQGSYLGPVGAGAREEGRKINMEAGRMGGREENVKEKRKASEKQIECKRRNLGHKGERKERQT